MIRRLSLAFSLLMFLYGCFATITAPTVIPVSDLVPADKGGVLSQNRLYSVVIERFRDERSSRSILGQYDLQGKGGFLGTVTIVPDRDVTEVFENVKKFLTRRGYRLRLNRR